MGSEMCIRDRDGLSYSRTTSVDDIRLKLAEKKEKQMMELRRIEDDIAAGKIERPQAGLNINQPIPGETNDHIQDGNS